MSLNYFGHSDSLHSITHTFEQGLNVVFGINGSGKTSLLKGLVGLNHYHSGEVLLDGEPFAFGKASDISFVFDDLGFFERRTLKKNLAYPFKLRKKRKEEYLPIIEKWMKDFDLPIELLEAKVFRLDDDFKVKASLIRGFYRNSKVIILDNPLASLNPYERKKVFILLAKFLKQSDAIVIYATDSVEEVNLLNEKTLVLSYGYVAETGLALALSENPKTLTTSELFIPFFNKFNVTLSENGFELFGKFFELDLKGTLAESFVGKEVILGFTPESVIEGDINAVSPLTLSVAEGNRYLLKVGGVDLYSDKLINKISLDIQKIMLFDQKTERIIFGYKEKVNEENC